MDVNTAPGGCNGSSSYLHRSAFLVLGDYTHRVAPKRVVQTHPRSILRLFVYPNPRLCFEFGALRDVEESTRKGKFTSLPARGESKYYVVVPRGYPRRTLDVLHVCTGSQSPCGRSGRTIA